jgi:hypothetical protein
MRKLLIATAIISTLIGLYFFYYGYKVYCYTAKNYDIENLSYLGQYVSGFVLSFFTLATFIMILLAYLNQRDEINNLKDMNVQQDIVIKVQAKKDEYEKFERTFYRLLDWHQSFMKSISYTRIYEKKAKTIWVGRGAINNVLSDFKENLDLNKSKGKHEALNTAFDNMFRGHLNDMKPYFSNLYNVLDFVDTNLLKKIIDGDEAEKFMLIVGGQLALSENELLFYYGLYNKAPKNLKEILSRNGLIKNMDYKNYPAEYVRMYN